MQRIKTVYVMVAIINLCAVTATFASEFYGEDDDGVSVEQALVCLKKERAYEVAITDEYIDLLNRHINSLNNIEQLLDLSHLTVLILSSNKLTALNGLANAPCLKHLYLSDNLFTALPSALCDFPALVVVDLLDNQITSVSQDDIVLHRPMLLKPEFNCLYLRGNDLDQDSMSRLQEFGNKVKAGPEHEKKAIAFSPGLIP